MGINVSAQTTTPVGDEFYGEWFFDHAQAQERPMRSQENYTTHTVAKEDLHQKNYFHAVPTEITFMEGGIAHLVSLLWAKNVTALVDNYINLLEFVEQHEMEIDGVSEVVDGVVATFNNLTLNGNTMSVQYSYFYGTGEEPNRKYTDGILTIYYKR
jgi:hypothetical protein